MPNKARQMATSFLFGAIAFIVFVALQPNSNAQDNSNSKEENASLQEQIDALKLKAEARLPLGVVMAFAGPKSEIPPGWLPCEGQVMRREFYKKLYKKIGTIYGGQGGVNFKLPDYRGYFLRGLDNSTLVDPDGKKRQVGSIQSDSSEEHTHDIFAQLRQGPAGKSLSAGWFYGNNFADQNDIKHAKNNAGFNRKTRNPKKGTVKVPEVAFTSEKFGGHETRPKNRAVHWIIKVKP